MKRRIWFLLIEHRPAIHMDGRFGAETEEAFPLHLRKQRDQETIAGGRDGGLLDRGLVRAAAVFGKFAPLELRLQKFAHFGERHVDRHADADLALIGLRHDFQLRRERACRLGLIRHDARFGLHAEQQRDRIGVDLRLRRDCLRRPQLEPEIRHTLLARAERNGAAHFAPLFARRLFDERVVAYARLQCRGLLAHRVVHERLYLVGDADLDAGDDRHRNVGDIDLRGEIGREPPVWRDGRASMSQPRCRVCRHAGRTPCRPAPAPAGQHCRR